MLTATGTLMLAHGMYTFDRGWLVSAFVVALIVLFTSIGATLGDWFDRHRAEVDGMLDDVANDRLEEYNEWPS